MGHRRAWLAALVAASLVAGCAATPDEPVAADEQALDEDLGEGWGSDAEVCSSSIPSDDEDEGDETGDAGTPGDARAPGDAGTDADAGRGAGSGAGSGSGSGSAPPADAPALREATPVLAAGDGVTPLDRPRPPRPPRRCRCITPNVAATSAAGCPRPRDVDRTDRSSCTHVDAGGNWSPTPNPNGERWQCGPSKPHHPCWPTRENGGRATHTHHDRVTYHFSSGCCFYKLEKDIEPVTCH